jgi:hypothetical protein
MKSAVKVLALLGPLLLGCSHQGAVAPLAHPPTMSADQAEAARASLVSHEPVSFKMLHQVVAQYQGQSYLMTGYLLGRKDGSFRVSASAALGLKLFDVAKVGGQWESRVYVKEFAERFDPANLGRAVERIYFLPATGALEAESGSWVSRSSVANEVDIDTVEDWRDDATLALRRKRYFKGGKEVLHVDFDNLKLVDGAWLAATVKLTDKRGFALELRVTGYEPGFPVSAELLRVQSP